MGRWIGMASLILLTPMLCLTSMTGCRGNRDPADQGGDGRRHAESEGGFSFIAPAGWRIQAFPGLKYKTAVGPAVAGFAPNINVVDESSTGSLDSYVEENLATLRRVLKSRLLKQDGFTTTEGLRGARVVVEDEQGGRMLRQSFYFFSRGKTKFVVTCSAPAESGDELTSVFEAIMKTFRFDKV